MFKIWLITIKLVNSFVRPISIKIFCDYTTLFLLMLSAVLLHSHLFICGTTYTQTVLIGSLRSEIVSFPTWQFFSRNSSVLPWILYFLLLSSYQYHSLSKCLIVNLWFLHTVFLNVGCRTFLDIKCPLVNLECPIWSLHSVTFPKIY